jgi:cytochrome bd ubiquinol oxidase subunit I
MTTKEALGPVTGGHVALTLAVYLALYALLLLVYLGVLVQLELKAAKEGDTEPEPAVEEKAMSQPVEAGE